ncbi:hypothetical protein Tco_0004746 [Tanacetum coccineum]
MSHHTKGEGPLSLVTSSIINTPEATTITTSLPEITPFITLQLRVARLEQEMSEVKKTDHSAYVLASIKSQVPTVVDEYLGTKLDDALLKILYMTQLHKDLNREKLCLPGPRLIKNQNLKESKREIIIIKGNKVRRNKIHLLQSGQQTSLIQYDAMAKEVASKVKTTRESMKVLIDEGPSAGSNQEKSPDYSSKKLKGIQTLTPAEQEAVDIMKALKESKKMSKRQPGTGGSNEGTGNILGVPDESTVISRASSEGAGSKPGVPNEEKLIL